MRDSGRKLIVPELNCDLDLLKADPAAFSSQFDLQGAQGDVACLNWEDYPYSPEIGFRIGWCHDKLLLKFHVREREILGRFVQDGADVYKDSCVELFISPEDCDHYYNFEFNCLGTALVQVGKDRHERDVLGQAHTDKILRIPSLGRDPLHRYCQGAAEAESWSLMVVIPSGVLIRDQLDSFKGLRCRGNFYKCGDDQEIPHYVSWNPILSDSPDFHRPECFGDMRFS